MHIKFGTHKRRRCTVRSVKCVLIIQVFFVLAFSSVRDHYNNRTYFILDEALSWDEARARCNDSNEGHLAVANSVKEFKFLRGMYDEYRVKGDVAVGAWIDGEYDPVAKTWRCESNGPRTACRSGMPWSNKEPNRLNSEHCIIVWYTRSDGVANFRCWEKMPAICAAYYR